MKKIKYLLLLAVTFAVATSSYAQAAAAKQEAKTAAKEVKTEAKSAAKEVKAETKTAAKEVKGQTKVAAEKVKTETKAAAKEVKADAKVAAAKVNGDARTKTGDKINKALKGPGGETVYTGAKGGNYYLGKDDKKMYLPK